MSGRRWREKKRDGGLEGEERARRAVLISQGRDEGNARELDS
jgi:hypothetical protein